MKGECCSATHVVFCTCLQHCTQHVSQTLPDTAGKLCKKCFLKGGCETSHWVSHSNAFFLSLKCTHTILISVCHAYTHIQRVKHLQQQAETFIHDIQNTLYINVSHFASWSFILLRCFDSEKCTDNNKIYKDVCVIKRSNAKEISTGGKAEEHLSSWWFCTSMSIPVKIKWCWKLV